MAVAASVRRDVTASPARYAIAAVLSPDDILLDLAAYSKQRAFEDISRLVAARHGLPEEHVLASLLEREKIGSTALGQGFAIPHARVAALSRPIAAFVRTEMPIPFDAPDGKPVSDLLVLLVPQRATEAHLLLLAEAAEMFCDVSFRERLRGCVDSAAVHSAFAQWRPS
jgi:PTS system nitrogen regulatory IIA component